jgi:hypothetical protein
MLKRYADLYLSRHPEFGMMALLKKKALNLAYELFYRTRDIMPDRARVEGDVAIHWRNLKRGRDGFAGWVSRRAERGKRLSAVGYISLGWLPAIRALGGNANAGISEGKGGHGMITFEDLGARVTIRITTYCRGFNAMNSQHGIVKKALRIQTADMRGYTSSHNRTVLAEALKTA